MKNVYLKGRYKEYKPGRILSLEDNEAEELISMGIGELADPPTPAEEEETAQEFLTSAEFSALEADAQKELLTALKIDGDFSNEKNRTELYASFLESQGVGGGE
jgi:hypothetical protein